MEKESNNTPKKSEILSNKQSCLLDHIEITVSEAEKRANGALNIREYFTVYLVETVVKDPNFKKLSTKLGTIWRRYTEFEQLHYYLEVTYPYLILPPLPEKRILFGWQKSGTDTFDPDFIDRRRAGLENFLLRIASHPLLCYDKLFIGFLQQEEGWKETCKETGYLQLAENKFKSLTVLPNRIKRTDERFEAIRDYSNELNNHLNELLKVRSKLAERLYTIYKLHANYGRVFSEWSAVEKSMGDGLQKAGHFLDSVAAGIDSFLEEEELVADQIKEYLFFAAALQAICKKRDMLQLQLQKAQETITSKTYEKDQVLRGKRSIMSRLFGTTDSAETIESKVHAVEQRIQEEKCNLQAVQDELNDFTREALADYERFDKQKVIDVKQTLGGYAAVQVKIAKQALQTWTHVKECLLNSSYYPSYDLVSEHPVRDSEFTARALYFTGVAHRPMRQQVPQWDTEKFFFQEPKFLKGEVGLFQMSFEHTLEKNEDLPCPAPISRIRVEKIEGGLVVAGVVVAANCQVALPVFGCLFILVGIVLTVASYRGPGQDEAPENYAARLAFTGNSRVLGPACIVVGFLMLSAGVALCLLTRKARKRERRVGFHCPIHGDFYPLSPVAASKALGKYEAGWSLCFGRTRTLGMDEIPQTPPQCPHTQLSSTRSSFSSVPISPCPTPMPFLVTSNSISSDLVNSVGANMSPDQTFGSIRSLSVCREVASFPLSRTPSPPPPLESRSNSLPEKNGEEVLVENKVILEHLNAESETTGQDTLETTNVLPSSEETLMLVSAQTSSFGEKDNSKRHSLHQLPKGSRKSVSIVLPNEENG